MNDDRPQPFEHPARAIPAWAFSVVFHAVLLTAIGWVAHQPARGVPSEPDRPVGVAMVERLPDRDRYFPPNQVDQSSPIQAASEEKTSATAASLAAPNLAPPLDLNGVLAEMTAGDVPSVGEVELEGAFSVGTDTSSRGSRLQLDGKPATAMLFGVTGSGSRFIYVFDRSDSMNGHGGKPLRTAKTELKQSLRSLSEDQQFQIIFYNDQAKPFVPAGSGPSLLVGEPSMIRSALGYVDAVKAFGGTEHFEALRMALRMGPDVIFFLTDARVPRLSASQFADIRHLADRAATSIHAIEFGAETEAPGDSFLRQLASENRGEYRYIQVDQLTTNEPLTHVPLGN